MRYGKAGKSYLAAGAALISAGTAFSTLSAAALSFLTILALRMMPFQMTSWPFS
jgi:hypothetical protein